MSDREYEEELNAPPPPGFSTPTKADRNDGAGRAEQDAEGTKVESDVEKQFDESTGMLAWEKISIFVCNGSIQASVFSTTFFAYVLFATMTHFSDRLFATQLT